MVRRFYVLALAVVAVACASTPLPKAPGSEPSEMTAAEHQRAAELERSKSEVHRSKAQQALRSHQGQQQAAEHREAADRHADFAAQHQRAGELASDER